MSTVAPGAEAISEFARQSSGVWLNGTCVEDGALMCAIGLDPEHFRLAPGSIGDYLQNMVNIWRAQFPGDVSTNGASNFHDAAWWLRGKGFHVIDDVLPTVPDFFEEMQQGIRAGAVYLVGVTNAQAAPGDEAGVHNHGFAALGVDDNGNIICGDGDNWRANVNMPSNPIGNFVTYTRQDFVNAQISSLTKVWGRMGTVLDSYFDISADGNTYTMKSDSSQVISGGALALYKQLNAGIGLPVSGPHYDLQAVYGAGFEYTVFQRAVMVYDPKHVFDSVPGQGDFYLAHIDMGPFELARLSPSTAPAPSDDEPAESAELAQLHQQIDALHAQAMKETQDLAVDAQQIAEQGAQILSLQQQLAAATAPDPVAETAKQLIHSLKAYMATLPD